MNELFRILLALPPQASTFAREIDILHYVVIGVSLAGAVGVAAVVAIFLIRFRRRPGHPHAHRAHVPVWMEAAAIAGLLAMFLAFWVVGFRQFVKLQSPPPHAMVVHVVGKQWMWQFAYPDGTTTTGDLYVPAGTPVKLLLTSRDVIHSFFVPDFRVKMDAVPGRTTALWFEAPRAGEHQILCTEYCGLEHSTMRGRVIVLEPEAWARWADANVKPAVADLAELGARIAAERGCLRCHTVDGTPHVGPTWAGMFGSTLEMATGERVIADEAYLTESMMDPMVRIRAGYAPIMPTYRGIIQGVEGAALVEYIRSLAERPLEVSPLPPIPMPTTPVLDGDPRDAQEER
jgi:cytochrome c oxidase subunit II